MVIKMVNKSGDGSIRETNHNGGGYVPKEERQEMEKEDFIGSLQEQIKKFKYTQEDVVAGDLNGCTAEMEMTRRLEAPEKKRKI